MQNMVFNFAVVMSLLFLFTLGTVVAYMWGIPALKKRSVAISKERTSALKDLVDLKGMKVDGSEKIMRRLTSDFHATNDRMIKSRDRIVILLASLTASTLVLLAFALILLTGVLNSLLS